MEIDEKQELIKKCIGPKISKWLMKNCMLLLNEYEKANLISKKINYDEDIKPYDKVLVRDSVANKWILATFLKKGDEEEEFPYLCKHNVWKECISYKGNEEFLGKITK